MATMSLYPTIKPFSDAFKKYTTFRWVKENGNKGKVRQITTTATCRYCGLSKTETGKNEEILYRNRNTFMREHIADCTLRNPRHAYS